MLTNYLIFLFSLLFSPTFVFSAPRNFSELMQVFVDIFGYILALLYTAGLFIFLWGIVVFLFNTEDDKKREEGKRWIFWGIIAFFVGLTLWGIVGILTGTFDWSGLLIPQLPE